MSRPLFLSQRANSPIILNFPHSGCFLPPEIEAQLAPHGQAQRDRDWHVPALYGFALGRVNWLEAQYSRYVVDLNRDPSGASLYPGQATTGLCPDTDFSGQAIYVANTPKGGEISNRKNIYFTPYHDELKRIIQDNCNRYGGAVLLDCHSIQSHVPRLFDGQLPDLNLGTNSGISCASGLGELAEKALQGKGFSFVRDGRFKGGWITRHFGNPDQNIHAIQLEIAQCAYMNENQPELFDASFAAPLRSVLQDFVTALMDWASAQGMKP